MGELRILIYRLPIRSQRNSKPHVCKEEGRDSSLEEERRSSICGNSVLVCEMGGTTRHRMLSLQELEEVSEQSLTRVCTGLISVGNLTGPRNCLSGNTCRTVT
jgi:hypothetical protein